MKNAAKTKPASLKAFQNALDRQEAYTKYGFTTEAEIKALQEKEVAAALAAHQAASAAYRGVVGASDANADTYRDAARAAYAAYQAAVAAYDAAALAEAEQATPSAAPSLTFKQVKAKAKGYRTALELAKATRAASAEQAPAAAPVTTWRDEIAGEIFPNGLADQGLDRLDFASISKTTLKRMIDRAYTRGLAEATRDARLPHNR